MDITEGLKKVVEGNDLTREEARACMESIMSEEATDAQKGAFLTALRMKGETIDEITGCVEVMREKVSRVSISAENAIDTCGTGGDGTGTINVSTLSAIVAAGAGARKESGERIEMEVKVNDTVLYARYAGTSIKLEGTEYLIMKESDILAIVEKN